MKSDSNLPSLNPLKEYLHTTLGLNFSERQNDELIRKMNNAAVAFGFNQYSQFINWLLTSALSEQDLAKLASHLTIGETYFLREKKSFDFLEQIYLPEIIRKRFNAERHLRIWCAGCATGEEAYSLAIVLTQTIPDIANWNISILATDINPIFLDMARNGIYKKWSFRSNNEIFIKKYFEKKGENEFHIIPEIKKMVSFSHFNLANTNYLTLNPGTQNADIIFCRNVLIYFSTEGARSVTERFYHSLAEGGILVVSPVEMSSLICSKFSTINYSGFTIYQKGNKNPERNELKKRTVPAIKPISAQAITTQTKTKSPEKVNIPIPIQSGKEFSKKNNLPKIQPETSVPENEFERAKSLYSKGSYPEAEVLFESINKSPTYNGQALLMLAKIKANLGKLKEAEELCLKGIALDKLNANFHYLLATVMQEQGDDENAINALKKTIYLERDFILAHFLLGTLFLKSGDEKAGMKSFKNALSSLSKFSPEDIIPESDGLTVEKFTDIINAIKK